MCRQAKKVKISTHRPFFADPAFYPSPPKAFELPVYAEAIASQLVVHDPEPFSKVPKVDPRVLIFVDDMARESDGETSDSDDSSSSKSSSSSGH
jgi:hypothetical protein